VTAACLILGACAPGSSVSSGSSGAAGRSPAEEVTEYVRLVVALGGRDPDSLDYAYPPRETTAGIESDPPPFTAIRARALAAADRLERAFRSDAVERWRNLARDLKAVAARVDLLTGTRMSFDEESQSLFGVRLPPEDDSEARQAYRELERRLPGSAPLPDRYARFQSRTLVAPARARAVFERALQGCRERTLQHLSLPPGERVEIVPVHDSPWNAFSRYLGAYHSAIQINVDVGLTVDGAMTLACHEGYPGHHTQNSLVEARLVHERGFLEFSVQPLFSPQALVAEGLAVQAVDLAFPGRDRENFERDVLYPLAGLDGREAGRSVEVERLVERFRSVGAQIARRYINGDLEFARAASELRDRALVPQPDALLKFLNEFRTYSVTYGYGPDWVRQRAGPSGARDAAARWRWYEETVTQPWALLQDSLSQSHAAKDATEATKMSPN
jgi:hypothetical protein